MSEAFDFENKVAKVTVYGTNAWVNVNFPIRVERFEREKFQAEGHFVPRMVDAEQRPREWDGPLVFAGELWHEVRDSEGKLVIEERILRLLADSPAELQRLFDVRVKETLFGLFRASQVQSALAETNKRLWDENNTLREVNKARARGES